jgi:hypothetical protein
VSEPRPFVRRIGEERVMRGFITTREILLHPLRIIMPFGFRVYARCIRRLATGHGKATFLECI